MQEEKILKKGVVMKDFSEKEVDRAMKYMGFTMGSSGVTQLLDYGFDIETSLGDSDLDRYLESVDREGSASATGYSDMIT